jgi:hypothetical protein
MTCIITAAAVKVSLYTQVWQIQKYLPYSQNLLNFVHDYKPTLPKKNSHLKFYYVGCV